MALGLIASAIAMIVFKVTPSLTHPMDAALLPLIGITYVLVELPVVIAVLATLPRLTRFSLQQLGFVTPNARTIGIAVGGMIAATVATEIIGNVLQTVTHQHYTQDVIKLFLGLRGKSQIGLFALYAIILAPIAEETVFRLFIFNIGLRYGGFWVGAILSGLLFGLAHLSKFDAMSLAFNALPLACVGMIFCGVYYLSRNAYASMIAHGLFNALSLVALLVAPNLAQ